MRNWIIGIAITVAVCVASFFIVVSSTSSPSEPELDIEAKVYILDENGNVTDEGDLSDMGRLIDDWSKRRAENEAKVKSQEIPVGEENFKKLIAFIKKNGVSINGNERGYVFGDSKGNAHILMLSKLGGKDTIPALCLDAQDGAKSFYEIDAKSIRPFADYDGTYDLEDDGTWSGAAAAKTVYEEFLQKIFSQKSPEKPGKGTEPNTPTDRRDNSPAFYLFLEFSFFYFEQI